MPLLDGQRIFSRCKPIPIRTRGPIFFATMLHALFATLFATLCMLVPANALAASSVVVGHDRIVVNRAIPFAAGSAQIPSSAAQVLKDLARALNVNPQFTKVRIEGHTDSTGEELDNKALSQRRADAVRDALIARGVQSQRLFAVGFGASDPLQTNASEEGREKNRRVVFEVLQVSGVQVKRPPLAKVSARRNDVAARAPLEESWRKAAIGDGLRRSWRLRTAIDSGAGITFRDATRIDMRQETLVIIYGATESKTRSTPMRASLQTGALTAWLQHNDGSGARLVVETPSGDAAFDGGKATVRRRRLALNRIRAKKKSDVIESVLDATSSTDSSNDDDSDASSFSNHHGEPALVFGKTKEGARMTGSVRVIEGYGSRVLAGKQPDAPRKLPPAPKLAVARPLLLLHPLEDGLAKGATLEGTWAPHSSARLISLQLKSLDDTTQFPVQVEALASLSKFRIEEIPAGNYELQAAVVDAYDLESDLSAPISIRVVALAMVNTPGESERRSIAAGDLFLTPNGYRCAVDDVAFGDESALVVGRFTKSVRCQPLDSLVPAANLAVLPLLVDAVQLMRTSVESFEPQTSFDVVIHSTSAFDAFTLVEAIGAQLQQLDAQLPKPGARVQGFGHQKRFRLRPTGTSDDDVVKLRVTRRGTLLKEFSLRAQPIKNPRAIVTKEEIKSAPNSDLWWFALPAAVSTSIILAGAVLATDTAVTRFDQTPVIGGAVDVALARTDSRDAITDTERFTAAGLLFTGVIAAAVTGIGFVWVLALEE